MSLQVCDTLRGSFTGRSSIGAISLPGARVGDKVSSSYITYPSESYNGTFEITISVDDQIQQISNLDYSTYTFIVTLLRPIVVS